MKKLVYMLTLAIGLIMTGCAQWQTYEPMPADTWGAVSELTVETPDTVTSDVLPIKVITKNAINMSLLVSETAVNDIDYTALLQGRYSGAVYATEVDAKGDTIELTLPGVIAGNTYYLYVVAANKAGVQTTYQKAIGAIDVEAPIITSTFPLTATGKGRTVTLTFNENIVRESGMGAVSYKVYDAELADFAEGNIEDGALVASGNRLTVTLPSSIEFAFDTDYFVLLSFAEGAVTDGFGNKMAAIDNYIDESGLPNGPWWTFNIPAGGGDAFSMTWKGTFYNGEQEVAITTVTPVEKLGKTTIEGLGEADLWSFSNFMVDMGLFSSSDALPFAGFAINVGGNDFLIIMDESQRDCAQVANFVFEGETQARPVWLGYVENQQIGMDVTFVKERGVYVSMASDVCLFTEGQEEGYVSLIAYLYDLELTEGAAVDQAVMASAAEQVANFDFATAKQMKINKQIRLVNE